MEEKEEKKKAKCLLAGKKKCVFTAEMLLDQDEDN